MSSCIEREIFWHSNERFITRFCKVNNATGSTCVAGTTYLTTPTPELTPVFSVVLVAQSLFFCVLFCGPFVDFCFNLFGRCWSFCPLFFDLRLMITPLVSSNSRPLCCLSYDLRLMITPLVSSNSRPLCCLSYDLRLWLPL